MKGHRWRRARGLGVALIALPYDFRQAGINSLLGIMITPPLVVIIGFVAQISLYGYLRTRAGMRYPELFANDEFVKAIDAAKWQLWLACLSDLSVYAGGLLARRTGGDMAWIYRLMGETLEAVLAASGTVHEPARVERARARLAHCDWAVVPDDATPFSESPRTLVECAPIIDELKQLDDPIVRNSVRFRW